MYSRPYKYFNPSDVYTVQTSRNWLPQTRGRGDPRPQPFMTLRCLNGYYFYPGWESDGLCLGLLLHYFCF